MFMNMFFQCQDPLNNIFRLGTMISQKCDFIERISQIVYDVL